MGTTLSAQNKQAMALMRIGLPAISALFIMWQPGCLQLTFATTALLALIQSSAFRSPAIRNWLGIQPLPFKPSSEQKQTTPYKGTITAYEKPGEEKDEGWGSSWRDLKKKATDVVATRQASKKATTTRLSKSEMAKAKRYEQQRREEIEAEKANKAQRGLRR